VKFKCCVCVECIAGDLLTLGDDAAQTQFSHPQTHGIIENGKGN